MGKGVATTDQAADVRARLVEAATELLGAEGPEAVQARRLAREIGASTTAVYHYFGGMPALLRAVYDEGFRRLEAHLAAVAITDDPITDIARLGTAYRRAARENPHLYDMMFGLAAPGGHRPEPAPEHALHDDGGDQPGPGDAAYGHLVAAAHRAVQAGSIRPAEPARIAAQLWSMLHGFVALELAGHFRNLPEAADQVLAPLGANLLIGLGGDPDRVLASGARGLIE